LSDEDERLLLTPQRCYERLLESLANADELRASEGVRLPRIR